VKMGRGFTLVEILAALVLLTAAMFALAPATRTLVGEIPQSYRIVQANTSVLNMLGRMREDVDGAKGLPESFGRHTSDANMLFIELSDGVICYQLKEGEVLRYRLVGDAGGDSEARTIWPAPNAVIEWRVWRRDGKGYAVEVRFWIDYAFDGRVEKRMGNSHVYFVGATGGGSI
jgi:prepilin-type N-terminal cleavage/methylation domain-containing protein